MERNIKIVLAYDGTNYHGWQIQKDRKTIQSCLTDAIEQLTGEKTTVYGSGRTDAGVHALAQVANFHTHSKIKAESFTKAMNAFLPEDIVVKESEEVDLSFHAQFHAKAKAYVYKVVCSKTRPIFEERYAHWMWDFPDVNRMRKGSSFLIGTHDFSSFEASNSPRKSSVRKVNFIDIEENSCYIEFSLEANGFLYRMVRNIVGTLLAVGRNQLDTEDVLKILESKNRKTAAPTLPAKGLFLKYVLY